MRGFEARYGVLEANAAEYKYQFVVDQDNKYWLRDPVKLKTVGEDAVSTQDRNKRIPYCVPLSVYRKVVERGHLPDSADLETKLRQEVCVCWCAQDMSSVRTGVCVGTSVCINATREWEIRGVTSCTHASDA